MANTGCSNCALLPRACTYILDLWVVEMVDLTVVVDGRNGKGGLVRPCEGLGNEFCSGVRYQAVPS